MEARRSNITSFDFSAASDIATAGDGSVGGVSGGGDGEVAPGQSCIGLDGSTITVGGVREAAGLSTSEYRFTLAGTGGGGDGASCRLSGSWAIGIS